MAFGNFRRVTHSVLPNGKYRFSEIINGRLCTIESPSSIWRLYVRYRYSSSGAWRFTLHKQRQEGLNIVVSKYSGSRNFHVLSASNTISFHAQAAWKTLSQICLCSGTALSPITRVARAMSIAFTRSNFPVPSAIAFAIGELVWSRRTWAEAEKYLRKDPNPIYAQAIDGQIYLTVFVLTLLEGIVLLLRAIYLTILFLPCIAMAPFADSLGLKFRKSWLNVVHRTLEKAGPAFIKWGQWAATRPDLFPQDLCTELKKLHTNAPAHSFALTRKTIENAFGRKLPEIFSTFEEEPVASGSVAQVHRATLKYRYPGQEIRPILVAVKVRHPSVGEAIKRDFMLMNFLAKISRFIPTLSWLKLDESIQQFAGFMMSQVDLAREAAYLSRFIYNFRKCKDVSFPRPLYPLVHPAVLVETYEQGENVLHYVDELEGNEKIRSYLAHIGTHALLKMLLIDNFIHADMHPGNILVRLADDTATHKQFFGSRPHLVFLDVGMTVELSKRDRLNLLDFFKAVAIQDGRIAAESTLKLSKQQTCPDPEAFVEEVDKCFSSWNSIAGSFPSPAICMQQLLDHVRRHKVNIDGNVCAVIVTTLVLEGWQRKLDPEYDVMHALRTLLFRADWADSFVYTIEGLMAP